MNKISKKVIIIFSFTVISLLLFCSCNVINKINELEMPKGSEIDAQLKQNGSRTLIAENERFELQLIGKTAEIIIVDKQSKSEWSTNGTSNAENVQPELFSQMVLNIITEENSEMVFTSYGDSVMQSQQSYNKLENGIEVTYFFGENKHKYIIPTALTKSRLNDLLKKMKPEYAEYISSRYEYNVPEDFSLLEDVIQTNYPGLQTKAMYILPPSLPDFTMEKISGIFKSINYTENDLEKDNEECNVQKNYQSQNALISIDFILEANNLVIKIPKEKIFLSSNIHLTSLNVVPNFISGKNSDNGYILIPDGSGALIDFKSVKYGLKPYSEPVYGADKSLTVKQAPLLKEQINMPVYGLKRNDNAIFAVIESGEELANINANKLNSVNNVYSSFELYNYTSQGIPFGDGPELTLFTKEKAVCDFQIKYFFLNNEKANYTAMAKCYQDYLVEKGDLPNKLNEKDYSLNLNLIGGYTYQSTIAFIPVTEFKPLTTYEQASAITNSFYQKGISNINVNYEYFANSGMFNAVFNHIKAIDKLGGNEKLKALLNGSLKTNAKIYPQVNLWTVYKDEMFDGFSSGKDTCQLIEGNSAYDVSYNIASQRKENSIESSVIVTPKQIPVFAEKLIKNYKEYKNNNISIGNLANTLNSDFRESNYIFRNDTKKYIIDTLKLLKENNISMIASSPNVYAFKYITKANDAPMYSSKFNIFDFTVPFYQLVVNGHINYSSKPINFASDFKKETLKCIETNTQPGFELQYASNIDMRDSNLSVYNTSFKNQIDKIVETYHYMKPAFEAIKSAKMTEHQLINPEVVKVTYDNGVNILINYSEAQVDYKETAIPANDYFILR